MVGLGHTNVPYVRFPSKQETIVTITCGQATGLAEQVGSVPLKYYGALQSRSPSSLMAEISPDTAISHTSKKQVFPREDFFRI